MLRDRLNIDKADRKIYKKIQESEGSLKGVSNIDLFLLAMTVGKHILKKREKLEKKEGYIIENYITDEKWHIIKSLAVYETKDMKILLESNKDGMLTIAEEYANSGIKKLNECYYQQEYTFIERVEEFLIREYDDQKIVEDLKN